MIHDKFPDHEDRIAVGIAGEGGDCFGFDDEISRDHDFGTGVCLWLSDKDMAAIGDELARLNPDEEAWEETKYHPNRPNLKDRIVGLAEDIGYDISEMLKEKGFIQRINPYLEADVNTILGELK